MIGGTAGGSSIPPLELLLYISYMLAYLIPSYIVYRDRQKWGEESFWLVCLNVLLGWTVVGWVAALTWALSKRGRSFSVTAFAAGAVMMASLVVTFLFVRWIGHDLYANVAKDLLWAWPVLWAFLFAINPNAIQGIDSPERRQASG